MQIRKATYKDLETMQSIFKCAREYMKNEGNPTQWSDNRPPLFLIEKDLKNNVSYIVEHNGEAVATFSYTIGIEPTYVKIYDGKWLNDKPYGTIHRIASNGKVSGIFDYILSFVETFGVDIRIDTHKDNKTMLKHLKQNNFIECGIIRIDDGTSRIAFQKLIN